MLSAEEAITAVLLLLPGFIVSMVYRAFYPAPEKSDFEKTLESLAFTLVVLTVYGFFGGRAPLMSRGEINWKALAELTAIAVGIGAASAYLVRKEMLHKLLHKLLGPGPAGGVDLYWRVFKDNSPTWTVVYLKGNERVLLGAPKYLDMSAKGRTLFLAKARRLDANLHDRGEVSGPGVIVPLDEISMIELYKPKQPVGGPV